jgi:hypothetical protein
MERAGKEGVADTRAVGGLATDPAPVGGDVVTPALMAMQRIARQEDAAPQTETPAPESGPALTGGLARPEAVAQYAHTVHGLDLSRPGMAAEERLAKLAGPANAALRGAGVPEVTFVLDGRESAHNGEFDSQTWTIQISVAWLATPHATADRQGVAATVYHEARHAEQWFRMAQARAGRGESADQIATGLALPLPIVAQAAKRPFSVQSTDGRAATAMDASVHSPEWETAHWLLEYEELVFKGLDARYQALLTAKDASPSELQAAGNQRETLLERIRANEQAYRALPAERDAFAVQAEFEHAYLAPRK